MNIPYDQFASDRYVARPVRSITINIESTTMTAILDIVSFWRVIHYHVAMGYFWNEENNGPLTLYAQATH